MDQNAKFDPVEAYNQKASLISLLLYKAHILRIRCLYENARQHQAAGEQPTLFFVPHPEQALLQFGLPQWVVDAMLTEKGMTIKEVVESCEDFFLNPPLFHSDQILESPPIVQVS